MEMRGAITAEDLEASFHTETDVSTDDSEARSAPAPRLIRSHQQCLLCLGRSRSRAAAMRGLAGWAGRDWAGSPGRQQRGAAPSELGSVYTLI